jgi:hypothetical protein
MDIADTATKKEIIKILSRLHIIKVIILMKTLNERLISRMPPNLYEILQDIGMNVHQEWIQIICHINLCTS